MYTTSATQLFLFMSDKWYSAILQHVSPIILPKNHNAFILDRIYRSLYSCNRLGLGLFRQDLPNFFCIIWSCYLSHSAKRALIFHDKSAKNISWHTEPGKREMLLHKSQELSSCCCKWRLGDTGAVQWLQNKQAMTRIDAEWLNETNK